MKGRNRVKVHDCGRALLWSFAQELAAAVGDSVQFELVVEPAGLQFVVPPDKSIVEVLTENGVFVPTSCTEGYCGVCETEVVEGVPDHRDDYLPKEKRESNRTMMVCCGRSKTPKLVLKL